jgi:hypothetical protein
MSIKCFNANLATGFLIIIKNLKNMPLRFMVIVLSNVKSNFEEDNNNVQHVTI